MSIKRRSMPSGKPARRPVSSPTHERVTILPANRMVPGAEYVGWLCSNKACAQLIAIADIPASDAAQGPTPALQEPDQLTVVSCPHCQKEDLYRGNARKSLPYAPKSSAS